MQDERTRIILDKAAARRAERATDIRPWVVTEYPDAFLKRQDSEPKLDSATVKVEAVVSDGQEIGLDYSGEEDVPGVLARFKGTYPSICADWDENTSVLNLTLPSPAHLHFRITRTLDARGKVTYDVVCVGKAKLHGAITKSIDLQKEGYNLSSILVRGSYPLLVPRLISPRRCSLHTRISSQSLAAPVAVYLPKSLNCLQ